MSERSVGVSVFAALLVAYRTELGEIWKQMFDDPKGVLRELIAQRQFGLAREVAREIGSEEASWRTLRAVALGLETEGRLADALSTAAEIGGRKEREFTQLLLLEAHAKKTAEIDVDEAELELMETAALSIRGQSDRDSAIEHLVENACGAKSADWKKLGKITSTIHEGSC
jgi:hypothetical protein